MRINQHEKVRFIKVNELKLTQIELFYFKSVMLVKYQPRYQLSL